MLLQDVFFDGISHMYVNLHFWSGSKSVKRSLQLPSIDVRRIFITLSTVARVILSDSTMDVTPEDHCAHSVIS